MSSGCSFSSADNYDLAIETVKAKILQEQMTYKVMNRIKYRIEVHNSHAVALLKKHRHYDSDLIISNPAEWVLYRRQHDSLPFLKSKLNELQVSIIHLRGHLDYLVDLKARFLKRKKSVLMKRISDGRLGMSINVSIFKLTSLQSCFS